MPDYNYEAFSPKDYDFDIRSGPQEGEKAPDCLVTTSAGEPKHLLDFEGDFLVLEMGSMTCPLFQSRRGKMERVSIGDPRVSKAVLYVREAHPGAEIPQHQTFEAKRACAERLKIEDGETRLVLVDDLVGSAHKAYGSMPNTVFIINRNGCVIFRAEWNNPQSTGYALDALLSGRSVRSKSYFKPALPHVAIRTLRRAGKGSAADFLRSFPTIVWNNLIKRNLRLLLSRPKPLSRDTTC
jgi:hypothetical protein